MIPILLLVSQPGDEGLGCAYLRFNSLLAHHMHEHATIFKSFVAQYLVNPRRVDQLTLQDASLHHGMLGYTPCE